MWIKIKEKSINFNNVVKYSIQKIELRDKGVKNGELKFKLWIETINENDAFGGVYIEFDTKIEVTAIIKQLDELLNEI